MSHEFLSLNNPYVREFLSSAANSNATTVAAKKAVVKASKSNTSYKHPAFLEAANTMEHDPFWKKLLQDAAKGKFMSNFFFDGVVMTYRRKGHTEVPADAAAEDRADIFVQFHQRFGVQSPRDMANGVSNRVVFQPVSDAAILKSLGKPTVKRAEMIRKYVSSYYADLPKNVQTELTTQFCIRFDLKILKISDITLQGGVITHIDGLDANEAGVIVCKDPPVRKTRASTTSKSTTKATNEHYECWLKYLKVYSENIDNEIIGKESLSRFKAALNSTNRDSSSQQEHDDSMVSESVVYDGEGCED